MGVSSFRNFIIIFFVSLCCLWFNCICDNADIPVKNLVHNSDDQRNNPVNGPSATTLPKEDANLPEENVILSGTEESSHSTRSHQSVVTNAEPEKNPSDSPVKVPKFGEPFKKVKKKENAEHIVKKKTKPTHSGSHIVTDVNVQQNDQHEVLETSEFASSLEPSSSSPVKEQDNVISERDVDSVVVDVKKSVGTIPVQKEHITPASSKPIATEASSPSTAETDNIPKVSDGSSMSGPSHVVDSSDHSHQHHPHHDAMPSFDEWKKMMLAEQQKEGHAVPSSGPPGKKLASQKRRRNYASYECGSKLVSSNPEGEGTSRILNELVDEYMLNPCKAKIWFVIELCESVQASQIELANFELFSSCPKEFAVYSSDNFPTRDWIPLGTFTAAEQRILQSFPLKQEGFGKFIKIELLSHYGKEHYCPLSVVRIFGTSMVDEYEEMETLSSHHVPPEDELDRLDLPTEDKSASNLFGSATDAVYNIVKKAAQVLGPRKTLDGGDEDEKGSADKNASGSNECKLINDSCSDKDSLNKVSATEYFLSATSMRRSLFQHLRRCDQCIYMSRPSYYSVSHPECRFFQAALGPVLFNTVCDWFKDNIVTLENIPAVHPTENATEKFSKPSSLPPTIISVIIDNNKSATLSDNGSDKTPSLPSAELSLDSSSKLKTSVKSVKSTLITSEGDLEVVISPTRTLPSSEGGESRASYSGSVKTDTLSVPQDSDKRPVEAGVEYADSDSVPPDSAVVTSEDSSPVPQDSTTLELNVTKDFPVLPDVSRKSDIPKDENITQAEESIVNDVVTPTVIIDSGIDDYSDEFRSAEERFADVKDPATTTVVSSATLAQKESVFMRMSNRIKALELNMSLSSQYLQELSQRYRRQMEEMQRAFNRTIGTLNDTARKAAEKDSKQQEIISQLQAEVANLTHAVDKLISDRETASRQMVEIHVFLMITEAIVMITIMSLCVRRISFMLTTRVSTPDVQSAAVAATTTTTHTDLKRRNSADAAPVSPSVKIQRRSVSEEVIPSGDEPIVVEPVIPVFAVPHVKMKKKNRKRKGGILRSASNPNMSPRKNAVLSSSFRKKLGKDDTCAAAGIIFSHAKSKGMSCHRRLNHMCENCKGSFSCNLENNLFSNSRSKRPSDYEPLKNLTNGKIVENLSDSGTSDDKSSSVGKFVKEKDRFTFRKLLRLQKRESI